MKRITWLVLVVGLAAMLGCAQDTPEAAARKIFEQQVSGHEGLALDTSGLVFDLLEQDDNTARVAVSGRMAVKATLPLVKKQGQWVLDIPVETTDTAPAHD